MEIKNDMKNVLERIKGNIEKSMACISFELENAEYRLTQNQSIIKRLENNVINEISTMIDNIPDAKSSDDLMYNVSCTLEKTMNRARCDLKDIIKNLNNLKDVIRTSIDNTLIGIQQFDKYDIDATREIIYYNLENN